MENEGRNARKGREERLRRYTVALILAGLALINGGCEEFGRIERPETYTPTPINTPTQIYTPTPPETQVLPPTTETPTPEATATQTPTPEVITTHSSLEMARQEWYKIWPQTKEQAAQLFGGTPDQWTINPDWDNKLVPNRFGIDYRTTEWRPVDPDNLPFFWPKTPKEAIKHFLPNLTPEQERALLPYIQSAWRNPKTGLVEGWHISEDHWMKTGVPDLSIDIHCGEVAEGYTVNGTQEPDDDRAWVVFGGFKLNNQNDAPIQITILKLQEGQGATIWMPGTDPQKIGLEQSTFNNEHYNWGKLGPDSYGFNPIYPCPQNSK